MIECLAVVLERLRVGGGTLLEIAAPLGVELEAKLAAYLPGDLVLDREDVPGRCIEALGPEGLAGRGSEQLHADPDAVPRFAQAAFEHITNAQFAPDSPDLDCAVLICKAGITGIDFKIILF